MDALDPDLQEHLEWNWMQTVSEAFLTSIVIWPHIRTSGRPKKPCGKPEKKSGGCLQMVANILLDHMEQMIK